MAELSDYVVERLGSLELAREDEQVIGMVRSDPELARQQID